MDYINQLIKKMGDNATGNNIDSIREFLLKLVIQIFCILGFLSVVMGGLEVFLQEKWEIILVYIAAYLPILICFLGSKRISYHHRAGILLLDVYLFSILVLIGVGLSGGGIPLLITFMVLTTTFLGFRMGLFSIGMSIAALLVVGYGMSRELLPIDSVAMMNSTRMSAWLMATTLLLCLGCIMVICLGILQNSLQKTIETIQEKKKELQTSNKALTKVIKQQEEMEAKLIKAEKFETIGLISGGVAHDLNNILSGVTTYPELLLMAMSEKDKYHEPLKKIKSTGDKAVAIVHDLLTLARRGTNIKEVLNFSRIIHQYLQSPEFERLLQFHPGITVKTGIEENLANISGSDIHLSNVIMNLISNAAEAMPAGGEINVKARNLTLPSGFRGYETIPKGEYAAITVADTGTGIPKGELDKIFEPFFTKKKMGRSGTGLGMAIVIGSLRDHMGFIDIESSENKGTRFTLYFPVTKEKLAGSKPSFEFEKIKGHGQTVLFVDDVKEQREVGEKILKDLGYVPVCRDSGEKAIGFCRERTPDLLISDMIMDPGISGYEVVKKIRKSLPDLPAIIISGYPETDQVKAALELGETQFLKKPYTVEAFATTIHACLQGQQTV